MRAIRYTLYNEPDESLSSISQVLLNRGIPLDKQDAWLSAGWESINDWRLLGERKMRQAVNTVAACVNNNDSICVLVDCDADGFTSSSMFINYLYSLYPEYAEQNIQYVLHGGKEHGLHDVINSILALKPKLLVSPDGSSNDRDEQNILNDAGIEVLILDHHDVSADFSNDMTNVINVQLSEYPSKALTGAGVVWQFCRAYDELCEKSNANVFLDLTAIGNAGDMASYKEMEIRAIMNLGLNEMRNPFLKMLAAKNKFILDKRGGMNYLSVAFGIVPFINAMCRSGLPNEKSTVFTAMLEYAANNMVCSSKRGEQDVKVPLCQEAITICERVKRRQTALERSAMEVIDKRIEEKELDKNSIIAVIVEPSECEASICGLAANKIQSKYQHPAMVLRRTKPKESTEEVYSGSARNYSLCEIEDMRTLCDSTGDMELAAGHSGAFGAAISESKFDDFIKKTNELYSDIDMTPSYMVDYVWNRQTIDERRIMDIGDLTIYGQGIGESLVVLKDIPLSQSNVTLLGLAKGHPTLKIQCGNVSIMKFGSSEEEFHEFTEDNSYLTCVGKCSVNRWNGKELPQILIEDFEVRQEWIF